MNFNANDFKIVHGATMEEIEVQVKALVEQGYCMQGTVVAQPNPHFVNNASGMHMPYLYYQILARQKQNAPSGETILK